MKLPSSLHKYVLSLLRAFAVQFDQKHLANNKFIFVFHIFFHSATRESIKIHVYQMNFITNYVEEHKFHVCQHQNSKRQ